MKEAISLFQNIVMWACIIALAIGGICWVMHSFFGQMISTWKHTKSIAYLALIVICTYYGGSKSITNKTSTDENIDLYDIDMSVSNIVEVVGAETNTIFVNRTLTIKVSEDSVVPQPIWFRENYYQTWTNVTQVATFETAQPVLDAEQSGNGTNVYVWVSTDWTNKYEHANWYIGTDLPAVHVDVDDTDFIVLDEFCMTSHKVRIKFHLKADFEYPEGTMIEIQRQVGNKRFETIDEIPAEQNGVYEWLGFEVGQRTSWRLHIAITTD